ncbi:MAG: pilus assembly protein [Pyrinomonadaceae bacterium]|nr:pilus assembly protein [Pyrinomonadaceae bacterium]
MRSGIRARVRRIKARLRAVRFMRNERGVQLAEMAIVLPLFIILFATTAEFGRFFYEYSTLAKAARAGSRYLVSAGVNADSDLAAQNIVVYGNAEGKGSPIIKGLDIKNVKITREPENTSLPQTVKVQILNYKYSPIFDLGKLTKNQSLSLNVEVKPSVTMRYLLTQPLTP